MFDYPILIPGKTAYTELGVGPEATTVEVADAHRALQGVMEAEKDEGVRRLSAICDQVPGLAQAEQALTDARKDAASHPDALVQAQRELAALEARAVAIEPRYLSLRDRVRELRDRITQHSSHPLVDPTKREAYDGANPPLELLKLADCSRDGFTVGREAAALVRRSLGAFLAARGEEVFHPTDLTRDDFTHDFQPDPGLDLDLDPDDDADHDHDGARS